MAWALSVEIVECLPSPMCFYHFKAKNTKHNDPPKKETTLKKDSKDESEEKLKRQSTHMREGISGSI